MLKCGLLGFSQFVPRPGGAGLHWDTFPGQVREVGKEEPKPSPTFGIGLSPLQPEGMRLEKTVKIIELDPKAKGVSEWPWLVLGMSQGRSRGVSGSPTADILKDVPPRVGLGHLGGQGMSSLELWRLGGRETSLYGSGTS